MKDSYALAVDLGASGGKLFAGALENGQAAFTPVHKFDNHIIQARGKSYWDFLHIFYEIKTGYAKAQKEYRGAIDSIAIDSWCNDYALLSKNGTMLGSPRNYRDKRTEGWIARADALMPMSEVYKRAGQQFARFETCYHLLAETEQDPDIMEIAQELVFLPDYLSYLLGAEKYSEYTIASVTNLYNIIKDDWDEDILAAYGLKRSLFLPIVKPGRRVGRISDDICYEMKTSAADIYAVGAHDTASAVVAAPTERDEPFLFISSGTWSLVGAEIREPVLTDESRLAGFGNEGGVGGRIRYLKSMTGLWLLQECVRVWKAMGKKYDFAQLADEASRLRHIDAFIDPDDSGLFEPTDMPAVINGMCVKNGFIPESDVELVRVITQSLACKYRYYAEQVEKLTSRSYDKIYILGGGSQNVFLNQLTANITGKTVVAGPADATAIGNILTQWIGRGFINDLGQARIICRRAGGIKTFTPDPFIDRDGIYGAFLRATGL